MSYHLNYKHMITSDSYPYILSKPLEIVSQALILLPNKDIEYQ